MYLCLTRRLHFVCFFFFNDTATTEIYTLSLHDALPILKAAFAKRMTGQELTPAEQALLAQIRTQFQAAPGGGGTGGGGVGRGGGGGAARAARYVVFAQRGRTLTAVLSRTGLSDPVSRVRSGRRVRAHTRHAQRRRPA